MTTIDKEQLATIDLQKLSTHILEAEYRGYFLDEPGREHYKLLAYFSTQFNGSTLLDVGTYKGCSALALAYNSNNLVKSFDIAHYRAIQDNPENVEFFIDDILLEKHKDTILGSPFIVLDTDHDGPFEYKFYNHLKDIEYKGLVMLDDIKLNQSMLEFWNNISEEKHDISYAGHHSGTGLVIFK